MKTPGTIKIHYPDGSNYINVHTLVGGQTLDLTAQLLILPDTLIKLAQVKWYSERGLFFYNALNMRKYGYWMKTYDIFMDAWASGLYLDVFPESLASMLILQNPQLFVANNKELFSEDATIDVFFSDKQPPELTIKPRVIDEHWEKIFYIVNQINEKAYNERAYIIKNNDLSLTMSLDYMIADRTWRDLKQL